MPLPRRWSQNCDDSFNSQRASINGKTPFSASNWRLHIVCRMSPIWNRFVSNSCVCHRIWIEHKTDETINRRRNGCALCKPAKCNVLIIDNWKWAQKIAWNSRNSLNRDSGLKLTSCPTSNLFISDFLFYLFGGRQFRHILLAAAHYAPGTYVAFSYLRKCPVVCRRLLEFTGRVRLALHLIKISHWERNYCRPLIDARIVFDLFT